MVVLVGLLEALGALATVGGLAAGTATDGTGDNRSSVEDGTRFVRFFGGRDLLAAGVETTAAATATVTDEDDGEDTGDKAGLEVEQLEAVEKRFVGVDMVAVDCRCWIMELLASPLALLLLDMALCDLECRIRRFIRPEEKLHKWHLYICCGVALEPPLPLIPEPPPIAGDR